MNTTILAGVGILFLLSGCAFSSVNRASVDKYQASIIVSKSFNLSGDTAIRASQTSLKWLGYDIESVSPELGSLRTKPKDVIIPAACDCGTWNRRVISGTADSLLQVQIDEKENDAVAIHLKHNCTAKFTGRNLFYMPTRRETYQCASRGIVENEFWDAMGRFLIKNSENPTQ